ncbi:hypothetical protein RhiirA1_394322 [Rhizophagus irregularis]|uniref:Uncharacterized protein n=1 Tax=Rhizophagus irregularis TaxID=588596 RepID=A0A2I1EMW1_9GLOM|nr:hypothetical protein RhiirA1_394322 [Rhizophagus irregularis]PKY23460.1 hypothetical protein RhiirB3_387231 [Rhizophagus irregularis]
MGNIRDFKVFTAGVESTQRVESINGVLKKHLDRGTLLKELVKVIEMNWTKKHNIIELRNIIGNKDYTTKALYYIDQIRSANVYTSNIKERVNKKIEFDSIISVVKTSVQVAVAEGVASELIRLLTQFIMKYRHNTRLNIEEVHFISHFNNEIQESFYNYQRQPLVVVEERNIPEISNPEYHKPKGRFPK